MHWTCEEIFQTRARGRRRDENFKYIYNLWNKPFILDRVFLKPYQHASFLSMQIAKLKQPKIHPQLNYIM